MRALSYVATPVLVAADHFPNKNLKLGQETREVVRTFWGDAGCFCLVRVVDILGIVDTRSSRLISFRRCQEMVVLSRQ